MNIATTSTGVFFAFFPHNIHQKLDPFDLNIPHQVHVLFGLCVLFFIVKNVYVRMALLAAIIDGLFHAVFTPEFETHVYFIVKVLLLVSLYYLLRNITYKVIPALIFLGVFSIYYRSLELFFGLNIGARVPDITLGSKVIKFKDSPWISTFVWSIIHFGAAYIPLYLFS